MLKFNDYLKEAALSAKQKKIAKIAGDKDKIDAHDLAALRAGKKPVEEASCSDKNMKKEELVGNQHKLDKNKNGKLDSQDFKMLRKEEAEQIDELKASTLQSYKDKAQNEIKNRKDSLKYYKAADSKFDGGLKDWKAKINKRQRGVAAVDKKLTKEETEQIDELSKKTLGSYVNKAAKDSRIHGQIATDFENTADKARKQSKKDSFERLNRKYLSKAWKREDGIKKAVDKLTKEDVQLEEATTRKDFQMVADLIKGHESAEKRKELATHHAGIFKKQNPRFDHAKFMKAAGVNEEVELDEGRMKELAMDLKDMSHDEFHKQYGKPKSHFDPTNFKKPVEPGKGMDRARALAQRGMQSLSKEEVERIEEKLTQLDELSKGTLGSYVKRSANQAIVKSLANPKDDSDDMKTIAKREKGINLATSKLAKEEVEQIDELSKKTLGSYAQKAQRDSNERKDDWNHDDSEPYEDDDDNETEKGADARKIHNRDTGVKRAVKKLAKEEVSAEMSPYLKATLKVMDEGKIDNLRDAQKLRRDTQSAYEKDYKPDTSHPHIQVVKGSAYGGANQKDDEGDEKPDETKEKKGRGRPAGSKSGARQKGGGHEDGGIPVHNLNLPKSYK